MNSYFIKTIIFIVNLFVIRNIFAENIPKITGAQITASTLSVFSNCLHYKIKGVCYWQGKTGINLTPFVEHYLPDLVITVYHKAGDNPWAEANLVFDQQSKIIQDNIVSSLTGLNSASGQHSFSQQQEQNVYFKEADVIGNPALSILPDNEYILLLSTATPFKP